MNAPAHDLHMLLAAMAYLMTRYSVRRSVPMALGVAHHLEMLLAHPEVTASPAARNTYQSLLLQWREMAACEDHHADCRCAREAMD